MLVCTCAYAYACTCTDDPLVRPAPPAAAPARRRTFQRGIPTGRGKQGLPRRRGAPAWPRGKWCAGPQGGAPQAQEGLSQSVSQSDLRRSNRRVQLRILWTEAERCIRRLVRVCACLPPPPSPHPALASFETGFELHVRASSSSSTAPPPASRSDRSCCSHDLVIVQPTMYHAIV